MLPSIVQQSQELRPNEEEPWIKWFEGIMQAFFSWEELQIKFHGNADSVYQKLQVLLNKEHLMALSPPLEHRKLWVINKQITRLNEKKSEAASQTQSSEFESQAQSQAQSSESCESKFESEHTSVTAHSQQTDSHLLSQQTDSTTFSQISPPTTECFWCLMMVENMEEHREKCEMTAMDFVCSILTNLRLHVFRLFAGS